jgi:hypothetical protein
LLAALCAGGCGEGADETTIPGMIAESEVPGGADAADVDVIQGWVETLAEGDVDGAAEYFAIPSIAENGPALLHIDDLDDARLFNESLPCGAELVRATPEGEFTKATFRLIERPGRGSCGEGTGNLAITAFLIEDGKIVEWRRLPAEQPPPVDGRAV